ncbi:MAG: hypothetical protein RL204_1028 [Bacteroidota bacterium]|jgi:hypothetical protein
MKLGFKKALIIFKYLSAIFTVVFWIYVIYDDYIFIEKYGWSFPLFGAWFIWFLMYFIAFAVYFWMLSSVVIIVRHLIVKRKRDAEN